MPMDWTCSITKELWRGQGNSRAWHTGGQIDFGTAGRGPGPALDWIEIGVSLTWEPCHSQTWQNESICVERDHSDHTEKEEIKLEVKNSGAEG